MQVCDGLIMLAAYFCHSRYSQVEYNCALIKVDCTDSGWRCICHFLPALAYNLISPPANGKQGLIPEEMSEILLTNKNQGNLD